MTRIGLISDTHGYLDEAVFDHFKGCSEIWHAGDFGSTEIVRQLQAFKPLRGVYGNIDGHEIRAEFPERLRWCCEGVEVLMVHIGGHPARYAPGIKQELLQRPAQLLVTGHSHILKITHDGKLNCLHINPGAAGKQGWHKMRTIVRLTIDGNRMKDCEVIELGKRG